MKEFRSLLNGGMGLLKLGIEEGYLKDYLSGADGIKRLMNIYFKSEEAKVTFDEPHGYIDTKTDETHFSVNLDKTKYALAICSRNINKLKELEKIIKSHIESHKRNNIKHHAKYAEMLLELLDLYQKDYNIRDKLLTIYHTWASSWCYAYIDESKKIRMHVHNNLSENRYSKADILASRYNTSLLFGYKHRILRDGKEEEPSLKVDFNILNRFRSCERHIGKVYFIANPKTDIIHAKDVSGKKIAFKMKKISAPMSRIIETLGASPYLLPFLEYNGEEIDEKLTNELTESLNIAKEIELDISAKQSMINGYREYFEARKPFVIENIKKVWGYTKFDEIY